MKFDGLDHLYQTAVLCYAQTWPEPLKKEEAWMDGKRERMFGILEGLQQAIMVVTEGRLSPEWYQQSHTTIHNDVADARQAIKTFRGVDVADEQ